MQFRQHQRVIFALSPKKMFSVDQIDALDT